MYHQIITKIEQDMLPYLNNEQMDALRGALEYHLHDWQEDAEVETQETDLITVFLAAKRVEGCSQKTVQYYDSTIRNVLNAIGKDVKQITTDDLRCYLDEYQQEHKISKVTIDNIRRILSTFFAWLEDESYIIKSPVRRIHKVKTCKTVKETYSDEALEIMRDNVDHIRDLAIIDMLASTGIRVGELITLDRDDIDFVNRECVVLGKGNKQRKQIRVRHQEARRLRIAEYPSA
jgi:site-specific recombinase XerD